MLACLALGGIPYLSPADIIHLKDGSQIEGVVKHTDDGWMVRANGKSTHIAADLVESIELTPATQPSAAAVNERLASLRRSVDALVDLNEIVARFQRFVDQSTDPAATADAKKDLAVWQDRRQQKMMKVGSKWVLPAEKQHLIDQAADSAETARQLMKQGRSKEAEPLLVDCIAVDPTNATALYLTGLLRYQQDQIPAARRAFEATAAIIPNHAPTLNNLGVVLCRQKQFIAALMNFDAAMLASPVDKTILDNVAIIFQNLPADLQKSPVTQKALRHFNEQDQKLAEALSKQGLRRYGSLWVTDKDVEQIRQQEKQIGDALDQMAGDFDRTKSRIDQLNQNISDNQTQISRIETDSYTTDPRTGSVIRTAYPSAYYDLIRDDEKLTRERDADLARLDALKKQARDLQNNKPSMKNQGVQQIIGPEGTPIRVAGIAPATQPAAR